MELAEVKKKARYGHRDWLFWQDNGQPKAAVKSRDAIKRAMLATGTQGRFFLVAKNSAILMSVNWHIGVIMLNNAKYGY